MGDTVDAPEANLETKSGSILQHTVDRGVGNYRDIISSYSPLPLGAIKALTSSPVIRPRIGTARRRSRSKPWGAELGMTDAFQSEDGDTVDAETPGLIAEELWTGAGSDVCIPLIATRRSRVGDGISDGLGVGS
jgi:hypothetical protein